MQAFFGYTDLTTTTAATRRTPTKKEVIVVQMWNLTEVARLKMDEAERAADTRRLASLRVRKSSKAHGRRIGRAERDSNPTH